MHTYIALDQGRGPAARAAALGHAVDVVGVVREDDQTSSHI